jgi:hypothetical protein
MVMRGTVVVTGFFGKRVWRKCLMINI